MRRLLVLVLMLACGGCGNGVYLGPEGPDPATRPLRCDQPAEEPSGMLVLLAQAVPSASAVPCLTTDAPDWLVTIFRAGTGQAVIEFSDEYGRDDDTVTLELTKDCDVGDAREITSRFAGTRRYDAQNRHRIWWVYDGACTLLRFHLSGAGAILRGGEISGALGFVSRAELDRQIRTESDGHLHLDP